MLDSSAASRWASSTVGVRARRSASFPAGSVWEVDPDAVVGELSVGQQQRVEIVKAPARRGLILDEATRRSSPLRRTEELFGVMRSLRSAGRTILFNHAPKLKEVLAIGRPH